MRCGKEILWIQAPCRPDGEITSDGQQETREGTCRCSINPEGCCVGWAGVIFPKRLKEGVSADTLTVKDTPQTA